VVDPDQAVELVQAGEYRPAATAELEQRVGARHVTLAVAQHACDVREGVVHQRVVEVRELVVGGHSRGFSGRPGGPPGVGIVPPRGAGSPGGVPSLLPYVNQVGLQARRTQCRRS
jgi:hypothetical protein